MNKHYFVRAVWDDDAKTYYTESDIRGLHIETPSLEEFERLVFELGPEMIMSNHVTAEERLNSRHTANGILRTAGAQKKV